MDKMCFVGVGDWALAPRFTGKMQENLQWEFKRLNFHFQGATDLTVYLKDLVSCLSVPLESSINLNS